MNYYMVSGTDSSSYKNVFYCNITRSCWPTYTSGYPVSADGARVSLLAFR